MLQFRALENDREIERLYRLDYGHPGEFWFRMLGTFVGAGIVWLYTGWLWAWVWVGLYSLLQLIFFLYLRSRRRNATRLDVQVAHVLFPLLLISFIWMPILMIASPDHVLSLSGFTILAGVMVFVVRRSEEYLGMMLFEIGILAVCLGIGIAVVLARHDDPIAWVGLIFGTATLIFYVTQASFIVRRDRLQADEIASRLGQAEKLEAIGRLAGGVAHDFNNLLTVILGNLELIREVDDPRDQAELLESSRAAALRGASVVRQLLAYARKSDGNAREVDVGSVFQSVEALCRTLVPATIALKVISPGQPIVVTLDDSLLVTAILNLIKNSIDATDEAGSITLQAEPRSFDRPQKCMGGHSLGAGCFVSVSVSDTGRGIPADLLSRVADPFFTTKEVDKGSGLGLAMVAGFAAQAGGGLQIHSNSNGTVVSILLPAKQTQLA